MGRDEISKSVKFRKDEEYLIALANTANSTFNSSIKTIIKEWHELKTSKEEKEVTNKELKDLLLQIIDNDIVAVKNTHNQEKDSKVMIDWETSDFN